MSDIFDFIAQGRYSLLTGADGTATVPDGAAVVSWSCTCPVGGAAGSVVITPGGAGQRATALPSAPVPAGKGVGDDLVLLRLGAGTTFLFTGTDAYLVTLWLPMGTTS